MPNATEVIAKIGHIPEFKPAEVRSLMKKLQMDEKSFAYIMNASPMTVRLWVTGAATPCNPAKRLMQVYSAVPDVIGQICAESGDIYE